MVTSSNGASTVVGASPRDTSRYSPFTYSMRIALVVVEPQSVATITLISFWFANLAIRNPGVGRTRYLFGPQHVGRQVVLSFSLSGGQYNIDGPTCKVAKWECGVRSRMGRADVAQRLSQEVHRRSLGTAALTRQSVAASSVSGVTTPELLQFKSSPADIFSNRVYRSILALILPGGLPILLR